MTFTRRAGSLLVALSLLVFAAAPGAARAQDEFGGDDIDWFDDDYGTEFGTEEGERYGWDGGGDEYEFDSSVLDDDDISEVGDDSFTSDDYGEYDSDYSWNTNDGWFDGWFGDSDGLF